MQSGAFSHPRLVTKLSSPRVHTFREGLIISVLVFTINHVRTELRFELKHLCTDYLVQLDDVKVRASAHTAPARWVSNCLSCLLRQTHAIMGAHQKVEAYLACHEPPRRCKITRYETSDHGLLQA